MPADRQQRPGRKTLPPPDSVRPPTPEEIKAARKAAGLSQTDAGVLVHSALRSWQQWEAGDREMHPAFWELFQMKVGNPSFLVEHGQWRKLMRQICDMSDGEMRDGDAARDLAARALGFSGYDEYVRAGW